jgi:hypothetical protein
MRVISGTPVCKPLKLSQTVSRFVKAIRGGAPSQAIIVELGFLAFLFFAAFFAVSFFRAASRADFFWPALPAAALG